MVRASDRGNGEKRMTISDFGWRPHHHMCSDDPLSCTVCGAEIAGYHMCYTPLRVSEQQDQRILLLFGVDACADFLVCEECTQYKEFDDWLDSRWRQGRDARCCRLVHDWRREGF